MHEAGAGPTRVLLVDDHAIMRSALRQVLERAGGIEVVGAAGSAEDAFRALPDLAPDVVVMDVRMPGLGGIDGTLAVKELTPGTRVLVLSMLADEDTVRRAMAAGADGYVPKTATGDDLVDAIRAVAAGGRAVHASLGDVLARPAPAERLDALTPGELEVARLVALGHTTAEIAAQLGTGRRVVEHARAVALGKLGARTRAELVAAFRDAGRFGSGPLAVSGPSGPSSPPATAP
jgi:DNA-binding NarL/FixJ family response regulator